MKVLILGSGMMGRAAAFFLAGKQDVESVVLADKNIDFASQMAQQYGGGKTVPVEFDASDINRVKELMLGCDVAIGATSYDHNPVYTRAAIESGCSLVDLGGNHDVVDSQFALSEDAKKAGITIVPDCGLAPGLVSILSARALNQLDKTDSIKIRVGGIPVNPLPPLNYSLVFSVKGLINEYIEKARIISGHEVIETDSMQGLEEIEFELPFGKMEAFFTSGGISTLTDTFREKVGYLDYKTIRYPGHCSYIKFLMDIGLTGMEEMDVRGCKITPREVLEKTLEKNLPPDSGDVILLRVTAEGEKDGVRKTIVQEHIDYFDRENKLTAMMRMTAFPAAAVALLIGRNIINTKGTLYQEYSIPFEPLFDELAKSGISIRQV
ncbi:MAG: saccharopine dehydrogenase NADP-binding domain-containing protein [Firmicutes bacterium]|nr:saccharopine dehydrogenase NADP-binding domain-containing protein [Bacillota bacterium]